jgi:Tfp pilus assembly protein PilF
MGLMSKPMVVTLPFVLLLLDWWPLDRLLWRKNNPASAAQKQQITPAGYKRVAVRYLAIEKIPLFVLSAISCVIALVAQKHGGAVAPLEVWPLPVRVINALGCYSNYISKMFYPKGLAVLYPLPKDMSINAAAMAIIGVVGLLALLGRGRRWLVVGLLWYLGTLVPVIGLMQVGVQVMADRYTYLPSIGVFIIIAWGAAEIFAKLPHPKPLTATAGAAALIAMVLLTRIQVSYWNDSPTLYKRALAVTENNYIMHDNYGWYLYTQGRYDEAILHFKEAARINPEFLFARQNICTSLLAQNKLDETIACLTNELQERNDWPEMHRMYNNLGSAYKQKGNFAMAEINFRKALLLKPDYELARKNLESVLAKQGGRTSLPITE